MKLIELSKTGKNKGKYFVKVDDEDFEWLNQWKWIIEKHKTVNYAVRCAYHTSSNFRPLMHREILKHHGLLDESKRVDHKDMDGLNNQKSNLRPCTPAQNGANRKAKGVSKYLGVSRRIQNTSIYWAATMSINKKTKHIGTFSTEIEAALAYNEAAKKYHGEFARLNIIN